MLFSVYPEQSTSPTETYLTGVNRVIKFSRSTNITSVERFGVQNNHVVINVLSVTTGGNIVVLGTSISESSGVPVTGDNEILTIDTTINQLYQTTKKWLEVTSVNITSDTVTGLTYETIILGYSDIGNRDFVVSGYRMEAVAGVSGDKSDVRFLIEKVQDDGSGKTSIVLLEDIGVDNETNKVSDYLRTGLTDRSYTAVSPSQIWPDNSDFVFKQTDFDTFLLLIKT